MACIRNFYKIFLILLVFFYSNLGLATPSKMFAGYFGRFGSVITDDVSNAVSEGSILAINYSMALMEKENFPVEGGIFSSIIFGQEGKSKFDLVPRLTWSARGEEFAPFIFTLGLGMGFTFLFLQTNNYGGFVGHFIVGTDVIIADGIAIGGESIIEIPLSNKEENPFNISVLIRVTHRWG